MYDDLMIPSLSKVRTSVIIITSVSESVSCNGSQTCKLNGYLFSKVVVVVVVFM